MNTLLHAPNAHTHPSVPLELSTVHVAQLVRQPSISPKLKIVSARILVIGRRPYSSGSTEVMIP